MKLINGNEFTKMADFGHDEHIKTTGLVTDILKQDAIIFCKIDYLQELFNFIRFSSRKYILITHNSDYPVDLMRFNSKPPSIKKWFGQNVIIDHPDVINIPIGLENEVRHIITPRVDYPWFYSILEEANNKDKITDTVYCNWNPVTNSTRKNITDSLEKKGIKIEFEKERLSHKDYCKKLSNYKYVICPPGNGVSTHRFWETLYLGSIPIVINHRIYKDYTLPIIKLNNWNQLTNNMLEEFDENNYSREMLDFGYWETLIRNAYKNIK